MRADLDERMQERSAMSRVTRASKMRSENEISRYTSAVENPT
jgi:hypothetical protein